MVGVHALDAVGDREDNSVILLGSPVLKIVPKIPNDVGRVLVTVAEELPVLRTLRESVGKRSLSPSALIKWGKQALQSICRRRLDDEIDMRPVRPVRRGQIIVAAARERRCERVITIYVLPVIGITLVAIAEGVTVTEQFYPERIESSVPSISQISRSICVIQVCQNRVGRIADDQKRNIIAVHHVAAVGAWLQRIGRRGRNLTPEIAAEEIPPAVAANPICARPV